MDLVTGASGFLGSHFCELLDEHTTYARPPYKDILTRPDKVFNRNKIETVWHLAADVGGIEYLSKRPYTIFERNMSFFLKMIEYSENRFKNLIVAGSVCEYGANMPMREDNINLGEPVFETRGYGWAKRAIYNAGAMFEDQYNIRVLHVIFTNLYGPGDKSSHVVAELVRKFCDAKKMGERSVDVWGNGEATRDLLYVSDAASLLKKASERYYGRAINIATGVETTIRELAETIAWACNYTGKIKFGGGPVGEKKRDIKITKMISCGLVPHVTVEEGIGRTVDWYMKGE